MAGHPERSEIAVFSDDLPKLAKKTLVIGDLARWKAEGREMPPLVDFKFVNISDLNADIMQKAEPDIILSPLVGDNFDAVDVAEKLVAAKFKGRYRAISEDLPDADLIISEIREFAPQLDFDLLLMPRSEQKA